MKKTRAVGGRMQTCPICGKKWILRCRRDQWGYWYNNSFSQDDRHLVLFCSGECSRAYADSKIRKTALRLVGTKAFKARQLYKAGMCIADIARALHSAPGSISHMITVIEDLHYQEMRYLDRHPEEVSA